MKDPNEDGLMEDVEGFCHEIRPIEELCYLENRFNDQLVPLAKKHNLLGMPVRREYGGRGADAVSYVKALERLSIEGSGIRTFFSAHSSIGQTPIQLFGDADQKNRYLPPSCQGAKILAFGLTEPQAGSNPLELKMTYKDQGDHYRLNGVKYLISNAGIADAIITFAYPEGGGRMSAFIVDTDQKGITREPLEAKLGMPTADTGMFELKDYPVQKANLLGREGEGFRIAMETLMNGRLSVAAGCLGVMADCLSLVVDFSKERVQHGKQIGKHQLIQEHIAMIKTHLDASRALVYRAAELKKMYDKDRSNKELRQQADLLIAEAKFFSSNAAWDAADRAVQVFGGRGYSYVYRPCRHLRDTRVTRIYEGTDEIMKLKIASAVLGEGFEAYR